MKFTKEQILSIASSLPDVIEFPDNWPVPEGVPGQWARVMTVDINNRISQNPSVQWNMERATNDPYFSPQHRPDWAMQMDSVQMYADPELAAWAMLNQISSYVMAGTVWQRRLAEPVPEPVPEPEPIHVPVTPEEQGF